MWLSCELNTTQENRRRAEEEKARRQAREQREKEINEKRHAQVSVTVEQVTWSVCPYIPILLNGRRFYLVISSLFQALSK